MKFKILRAIKSFILFIIIISIISSSVEIDVNGTTQNYNDTDISLFTEKNTIDNNGVNIDLIGIDMFEDIHYINNANYFIHNSAHAENTKKDNPLGVCTTVAMQLLMGYHNYYTDRRLIPRVDEENVKFLADNYALIALHPDFQNGISSGDGSYFTGTLDTVYDKLIELNDISGVIGLGQMAGSVANGAEKFVRKYAPEIKDEVKIFGVDYRQNVIINQLDNNNPVALGYQLLKGGATSFHFVVAYGYAIYNDEFGYIVHYGWKENKVHIWIPARWIGYQITMHFEHEHNFVDTKNTFNTVYRELICSECGANTYDYLFDVDSVNGIIKNVKYPIYGDYELPDKLYGTEILSIGDSAFKNCTELTNIEFTSKIFSIGSYAFEGCSGLNEIILPAPIYSIGNYAFKDCSQLKSVTIQRNYDDLVILGNNAFYGCENLELINVPKNKVLKYKSANNWVTYKEKIIFDDDFTQYYIDCVNPLSNCSINLKSGIDTIFKIDVGCSKSYKFIFTSDVGVMADIYNLYFYKVSSNITYKNDLKVCEVTVYLTRGTYYFDIYLHPNQNTDNISSVTVKKVNIESCLTYPITSYPAMIGTNNILLHLHKSDENNRFNNFLKLNHINCGVYRFKLIITDENGPVDVPRGAVTIYEDEDKTKVFKNLSIIDDSSTAINQDEQLLVYLNDWFFPIYIDIVLDSNNYLSVELLIETVDENEIDLYDINQLTDINIIELSNCKYSDYIEKIILRQPGRFSINFTGFSNGVFLIIEEFNTQDSEKDYRLIYNISVNDCNNEFILDDGTYYMGYYNSTMNGSTKFKLIRKIHNNTDINIYQNGGTEVSINCGNNNDNTITQGFTRLLFLTSGESRLDYCWYTNNDAVSKVTDVGTLIALNVNNDVIIKVMAISKNDPSIVLQKDFLIKKEENENSEIILKSEKPIIVNYNSTEIVQIDMSALNVPINWIQYYKWESNNSGIKIDKFGRITVSSSALKGDYIITGQYELNSRFKIEINVRVI